jgi:hypothetical protein
MQRVVPCWHHTLELHASRCALTQTTIDHADGSFFLPFFFGVRLLGYFAAIVLGKGPTMWMMG